MITAMEMTYQPLLHPPLMPMDMATKEPPILAPQRDPQGP